MATFWLVMSGAHKARADAPAGTYDRSVESLRNPAESRWIVVLNPGANENPTVIAHEIGGEVEDHLETMNAFTVSFPASRTSPVVARLASHPSAAYIEPDVEHKFDAHTDCATDRTCIVPNDPYFPRQWYLQNDSRTARLSGLQMLAGTDIAIPLAWKQGFGGPPGATVAVIDSGIDYKHPDLTGSVASTFYLPSDPDRDTDVVGHGTAVAGVIGARTNNGVGIAGIAPYARLVSIKAGIGTAGPTCSAVAGAIVKAVEVGADIINLSLGSPTPCALEQDAVSYAWDAGALIVAAAGNQGAGAQRYPAAFDDVVSVAATDPTDQRAPFSNYGASWVDVAAPGVRIQTTRPTSSNASGITNYDLVDGTSFAAPIVTGIAALIWPQVAAQGGATNEEVAARLFTTSERIAGTGSLWRFGRVNACLAMTFSPDQCAATPTPTPAPPAIALTQPAPTKPAPAPSAPEPPELKPVVDGWPGTYRGRTSQSLAVKMRLLDNRRLDVGRISVRYGCRRGSSVRRRIEFITPRHARSLGARSMVSRSFILRTRGRATGRVNVSVKFHHVRNARGVITSWQRFPKYGRCSTGRVTFNAVTYNG